MGDAMSYEARVTFSLFVDEHQHLRWRAECAGLSVIADTLDDAATQLQHALAADLDREGQVKFR